MPLIERAGLATLHLLDPERAHDLSLRALRAGVVPLAGAPYGSDRLRSRIAALTLENPVGLAAGYDKNAVALPALMRAGFGFVECGAVTPRPQQGNARPRLFRFPEERGVINRFGFNNDGAEAIARRLRARPRGVPVGLNIGANKDSADRAEDFARVVGIAGADADFLTVNVSSPNTEKLRELQGAEALSALLSEVRAARDALPVHRPIFLKISPDLDEAGLADIARIARDSDIAAIIATNTTLSRDGLTRPEAAPAGGLSGRPLRERSTRVLARLYRLTEGQIPLIGVGGIESVEDAWQKFRAGASAIQIYSALVYEGFSLATKIARGLDQRAAHEGLAHLSELTGRGADDWAG